MYGLPPAPLPQTVPKHLQNVYKELVAVISTGLSVLGELLALQVTFKMQVFWNVCLYIWRVFTDISEQSYCLRRQDHVPGEDEVGYFETSDSSLLRTQLLHQNWCENNKYRCFSCLLAVLEQCYDVLGRLSTIQRVWSYTVGINP